MWGGQCLVQYTTGVLQYKGCQQPAYGHVSHLCMRAGNACNYRMYLSYLLHILRFNRYSTPSSSVGHCPFVVCAALTCWGRRWPHSIQSPFPEHSDAGTCGKYMSCCATSSPAIVESLILSLLLVCVRSCVWCLNQFFCRCTWLGLCCAWSGQLSYCFLLLILTACSQVTMPHPLCAVLMFF